MINNIVNYKKHLFITALLMQFFAQTRVEAAASQSAGFSNYAEMATALAGIPLEISAHIHSKRENGQRTALVLHAVADVISITNKILFIKNFNSNLTPATRDFKLAGFVNFGYMIRDFWKLGAHVREAYYGKQSDAFSVVTDVSFDDFDFPEEAVNVPTGVSPETIDAVEDVAVVVEKPTAFQENVAELATICQMYVLPSLKGLTAFALACLQPGVTNYAGPRGRNVLTAAHSFIRLSEEFLALKEGSSFKKLLAAALCANVAWLIYEATQYPAELNEITARLHREELVRRAPIVRGEIQARLVRERAAEVDLQLADGLCGVCGDNDGRILIRLNRCNHATACADCVGGQINNFWNNDRPNFDHVRCMEVGCHDHMTRLEIETLLPVLGHPAAQNAEMLAAYDARQFARAFAATPEGQWEQSAVRQAAEMLEFMRENGGMECPQCHAPFVRNNGCDHITCACHYEYCYRCAQPWAGHGGLGACRVRGVAERPGYNNAGRNEN